MAENSLKECLAFNPEKARAEIVDFIRSQIRRFNKKGTMIGLSGGLDSSTVAFLCVEALGKEKVMGLILPERDTTPKNTEDGIDLAEKLGIPYKKIDISPILEGLGAYTLFPKEVTSSRSAMEEAVDRMKRMTGKQSAFAESFSSIYTPGGAQEDHYVGRMHAFMTAKTRARMMTIYFHAIIMDYLVVGTDDLSELTIGFYDKYGDGACDISILSHLFKTQIKALAAHIGVPEHIVNKPSSHDLWGEGMPNEETIGLPYEKLDMVLCGLMEGLWEADIADMAGVRLDDIVAVKKSIASERVRRSMPISVNIEPQAAEEEQLMKR
ncbi:NH(3)-dependent NAD(+) synthetase [Methanocella paludicola SANAE]|uniref:NH(3)-dependent NAD(+) synthetase n=1 Tax=Methanocella paludicola (strain DSM 17711 / JCM 13418 / NBRC 101707 / SANAE) TaxID=304371 RepID=D1YVP5_METPS|nr:NAD(+) synthase [Methanocella paludicola]BAI60517.1 NH(3)-dependent NAD(+) synthetase [Methanocella paludicola SANAE]